METKKMDRRVRKTRMQLRIGLTQLMQQKPIKDITVRELAELVDINRCTFYLHYRDIFDMVEQVENEVFTEFDALLSAHPPREVNKNPLPMLLDLFTYLSQNASLYAAFLGKNGDIGFDNRLMGLIRKHLLELWLTEWKLEEDRFAYFFSYIASGCIGLIREWFRSGMRETPEEMAQLTKSMIVYGTSVPLSEDVMDPDVPLDS